LKRPFNNDQINYGQGHDWFKQDPIEDPEKAAEIHKQLKELQREHNG